MRPSLFLLGFLAAFAPAFAATYIVDGVNPDDVVNSSRFYDAGKGNNWTLYSPHTGRENLATKWKKTKDYSFFQSDYADRFDNNINDPTHYDIRTRAAKVIDDSNKCWAYTSSNVIQYWVDTYGVFYGKGTQYIDSGDSYATSLKSEFEGIQHTKRSLEFYDNTNNLGGSAVYAFSWWFCGGAAELNTSAQKNLFKTDTGNNGGYFADHFKTQEFGYEDNTGQTWATAIGKALGYTRTGNTYTKTEEGQIAYISITGHAVTCYGFEVDDNGELISLLVANSDNAAYSLDKVYVDENGYLYSDASHQEKWTTNINGKSDILEHQLNYISYIKTPDSLKQLLKNYRDSNADLVWLGGDGIWQYATNSAASPDSGCPWTVHLGFGSEYEGDYRHHFDSTGKAILSEYTANRAISVKGDIETQQLTITTGEGLTDTLTGEGSNTLTAKDGLKKQGKGTAKLAALKLAEKTGVHVEEGSLSLLNQSGMQLAELVLANGTVFGAYTGSETVETQETTLTLGSGSKLTAGSNTQLLANLVLNGAALTLTNGGLTLGSTLTLGTGNTLLAEGGLGERFILMNGVDSLILGNTPAVTSLSTPVDAHDYFNNLAAGTYNITYSNNTVMLLSVDAPETGSSILCLLGLVGSATYRRRKRSKS